MIKLSDEIRAALAGITPGKWGWHWWMGDAFITTSIVPSNLPEWRKHGTLHYMGVARTHRFKWDKSTESFNQTQADANLIASAPDLLRRSLAIIESAERLHVAVAELKRIETEFSRTGIRPEWDAAYDEMFKANETLRKALEEDAK